MTILTMKRMKCLQDGRVWYASQLLYGLLLSIRNCPYATFEIEFMMRKNIFCTTEGFLIFF